MSLKLKNMKIALCLFKYFPYGGLQRDFLRIAQELVNRGHDVRVYTESWQGDKPQEKMDIVLVPVSAMTNHGCNEQYHRWVFQHLSSHPVDRVVGFNRMPGLDVYFGADTCYAEKVQKEKNFFYKLTSRYKHYASYEKQTVGKGLKTKLMIITPTQKVEYQKHYQTEEKRFYLLPPGIARDRHYSNFSQADRSVFRQQLSIEDDQLVMLQIGSDFKRKGVDRSITALASLPDKVRSKVVFLVVGQDNETKYQEVANKLGVKQQVRFLGGRDDVAQLIAAADLFVHPARSEAAGEAILEAMVGGLPQIVTKVCGYAHYVDEAQSGVLLADPFDQNEFNRCLLHALDWNQLSEWRQRARLFADQEDLYSLPRKAADIILG